jgi:elongation factor Ts
LSDSSQQISASVVAELRRKTGAGMMDCKEALTQSGGDLEGAIEFLRKKGKATARKRADRAANEGLIVTAVSADGRHAAMAEVNSETDFVARNAEFRAFAQKVTSRILEWKDGNGKAVADLQALPLHGDSGPSVGEELTNLIGKIGEKLEIRRFHRLSNPSGLMGAYVHSNSKLGVLINLDGGQFDDSDCQVLAKDLAMQVAAATPLFVHRQEIPQERIAKEKEILAAQMPTEGKPPQVIEKIVAGKLGKFFSEVCLVDQPFIKDPNVIVGDLVAKIAQKSGKSLAVLSFIRFQVGE